MCCCDCYGILIVLICLGRTVLECRMKRTVCVCVCMSAHAYANVLSVCMDSAKRAYSEVGLPAGHHPVPLCGDRIASTGLQKHCNFVVTIITSCYASPNDTSLLGPSQRVHPHTLNVPTASSGHRDRAACYFFFFFLLRVCFSKVSIKARASSDIKEADCGFPGFQGSAAAKNPVKLDGTALACPPLIPGPCLFDSFAP